MIIVNPEDRQVIQVFTTEDKGRIQMRIDAPKELKISRGDREKQQGEWRSNEM